MTQNFSNATNVYNNNAISQFPDSNNIIIIMPCCYFYVQFII